MYSEEQLTSNFAFKAVDHQEQPHNVLYHYRWEAPSTWQIHVSRLPWHTWEHVLRVRALTELTICLRDQIALEEIEAFNADFLEMIRWGLADPATESGNQPHAPQHLAYLAGIQVERDRATEMRINLDEYYACLERLRNPIIVAPKCRVA